MAGVASGGSGESRPYDGSELEGGVVGEALAEWRSSEQLENGTPSTSPPFWDTDDDDEDWGLRPSKLYGKYTWKIDKFSQINKRELRSNAFEVGGYKWYILIYPQGCDVCNHLSLFLCVANHDKLLPGWSHFAQFTIAVVNKDPKKSKYSDTLHRFWKKEHDWGWKKFMELSKVMDGFIDADTLIIKAQVQVIREKADRPFRCLDCQYRRELVRVYLTNVEQICRRYVEEKRSRLGKLIEDKARWSSFCAFWLEMDQNSRRSMIREKTDSILRAVVKQFFIEKEVTSTLAMDSLYSGLKALDGQIKSKNDQCKLFGTEEPPIPVVRVDQDMFVLVDDVLLLLERAAFEPLPPKDDKGPQNRMKDGGLGDDFSMESIERDERRLTELGRRTIEMFVLARIFSKIEVAYQEAVALKRQEELIREEAAWLEALQKSKRGAKEKKSRKKQGKQKRNNRKGKDKGHDETTIANALDKLELEGPDESKDSMAEESKPELEKLENFEDCSDASDTVDHDTEVLHPDSEERESSPLNWDTNTSEILPLTEASGGGASPLSTVQNGIRESNGSWTAVDDSSSTCSTDSVPCVIMNGSYKANNPLPNHENRRTPTRERKQRGRASGDMSGWIREGNTHPSYARRDAGPQNGSSGSNKAESEPEAATESLLDTVKKVEPQPQDMKGQVVSHQEPSIKDQAATHRPLKEKTTVASSSPISSSKIIPPIQPKLEPKIIAPSAKISIKRPLSDTPHPEPLVTNSADVAATSRSELHKSLSAPKPTDKPLTQEMPVTSRPLSAPSVPGTRPTTSVVSIVRTQPFLSRSVSAVGLLDPDPTPITNRHQSYRNAMMGANTLTLPTSTSSGYTRPVSPSTSLNLLQPYQQPANVMYPTMVPLHSSELRMVNHSPMQNDVHTLDIFKHVNSRTRSLFVSESPACTSSRQSHGLLTDEFPHLDIINDLLDDESGTGNIATGMSTSFQRSHSGTQHLRHQLSYPEDITSGASTSFQSFDSVTQHHHRLFSYPEDIVSGTCTSFQSFDSGPQHHHRQFSYPEDIGITNDMLVGTSTSSCRLERSRSYQENGFQPRYNSFGAPFESTRDFFPQPHLRPFLNGQIEGVVPNRWHVMGSDLSYLNTRTSDGGRYPYHIPDYSNSYTVFRQSNGQ